MTKPTTLDEQIISTAKKHFLAEGIQKTDMKQLAAELGISRSTLYRHFSNSLHIAFFAIKDYLELLTDEDEDEMRFQGLSGFDAFALYIHRLVDRLCDHLDLVRVIHEFDALYYTEAQNIVPPEEYSSYISSSSNPSQLVIRLMYKGLGDGTIKPQKDPRVAALSFVHTAFGLVDRIMLRESIYLEEHGAAREFIDYSIDLMLAAIKA